MKLEKMDDFFAARVDGSRLAGITKTPAGQCPAGQTVSKAPVFEKKIGALLTV